MYENEVVKGIVKDIDNEEEEAYRIYQEGYKCFYKFQEVLPTGIELYVDMDEQYPEYDPERGIACYKKAIELGSLEAMVALGDCYRDGKYIEKDLYESVMLYLQAAAEGSATARIRLAMAYKEGEGVEQSAAEAIRILSIDAERGESVAQYELGRVYAYFAASAEDAKQAISWLEKASESEDTPAYELLGLYYSGLYIREYAQPDAAKADYYLEKALAAPVPKSNAAYILGSNIVEGLSLIKDYDRAEILLEQAWQNNEPDAYYCVGKLYADPNKGKYNLKAMAECLEKAAEAGSEIARETLQKMPPNIVNAHIPDDPNIGNNTDTENSADSLRKENSMDKEQMLLIAKDQLLTPDYKEGFDTIRQMAQEGYAKAQYQLGMIYYEGKILPINKEEAYGWLDKAAEAGDPDAEYQLGLIYYGGDGKETRSGNDALAAQYFEKAAMQDHIMAQYYLGNMYTAGEGGRNNMAEGINWIQKAADKDFPDAIFLLSSCYLQGTGIRKDIKKGCELMQKAADLNYSVAQGVIGSWYLYGTNVSKNIDLAVKYLQMAVDNGENDARADLATALKKKNKKGLFGR